MRIKTIEIEGESFSIAPLNVAQVEEFVAPDRPEGAPDPSQQEVRIRMHKMVACGLNNALPQGVPEGMWTVDRVRAELSWPAFNELHSEILAISGFKRAQPTPAGDTAAGETQAPLSPVVN